MIDVRIKTEQGHVALSSERIISISDRGDGACLIAHQYLDNPATVVSSQPAAEVFQAIRDAQRPVYPDPFRDTIPPALYDVLDYYGKGNLDVIIRFLGTPELAVPAMQAVCQALDAKLRMI